MQNRKQAQENSLLDTVWKFLTYTTFCLQQKPEIHTTGLVIFMLEMTDVPVRGPWTQSVTKCNSNADFIIS